ncbi:MAG: hypothetical protein AABX96_03120 [Nanoarchaeota archaeon]
MAKLNFWIISLFIFATIFAVISLSLSIWVYNMGFGANISAHSSSEGNIGLSVEGQGYFCGDSLCNGVETCSSCSSDCGACSSTSGSGGSSGGGGGGGGVASGTPNFELNNENFNLKIVSGESETNEVILENTGVGVMDIKIAVTGIEKYISFNTDSIHISPGESFSLIFTIDAPEPGVYAGKIILTYQGITREVLILLNVISEGVLFDTTVTVPDLYRVLRPGQRLPALIELIEIGDETGVDVTMNYIIKDFDGNVHYTESETFYVLGAKSYSKRFSTNGLDPGDYILGVELIYIGGFATSTAHFRVTDSIVTPQTWVAVGALVVALVVALMAVIFFRRHSKQKPFKLKSRGY